MFYLSPATDDESQLDQITDHSSFTPAINRNCLLDPSLDGFFYRTDGNLIEQWQLWDDDDLTGSRPRPPASPFGQHQALYHDDLTQEMHQYLRQMDDEDHLSTCSCTSSSDSSKEYNRVSQNDQKSKYDTEQVDISFSQSCAADPTAQKPPITPQPPIIIEKVVPNPIIPIPHSRSTYLIQPPPLPQQSFNHPIPIQETTTTVSYAPYSESYRINERGEKITSEGNRILYMDVIHPNMMVPTCVPQPYITQSVRSYSHRRRPKHVPIIDLQSIENIFNERKSQQQQRRDPNGKNLHEDNLTTSDMLEIVEGYFEDYNGRRIKLDGHNAQEMLGHFESSAKKDHRRSHSANAKIHRRRSFSTINNTGPSMNYVESSAFKSLKQPPEINNEQGIYATPSTSHPEPQPLNPVPVPEQNYMSPFRYMQSSINPSLLRDYRNTYGI